MPLLPLEMMLTYLKIAAVAVVIFALPQSAQGQTEPPSPGKDLTGDVPNAEAEYAVRGVPRDVSDVDHVIIRSTDASSPITATWYLRSGWTISAIIETEFVEQHLLPKHETADIAGHGVKIHTEMTFGDYTLNKSASDPVASLQNDPDGTVRP